MTIASGWPSPEVQSAMAIIAEAAGKDHQKEIHPDDNLELDLGLDSMERVELLTDLAHRLGAEVEDSAASEVYTVRELVELVRLNMGKTARQAPGWGTVFEGETTDPEVLAITHERPIVGFPLVAVWQVRQVGFARSLQAARGRHGKSARARPT